MSMNTLEVSHNATSDRRQVGELVLFCVALFVVKVDFEVDGKWQVALYNLYNCVQGHNLY